MSSKTNGTNTWDPSQNCISICLRDADASRDPSEVVLEFTCAHPVRVFILWPHRDAKPFDVNSNASADPVPDWLGSNFQMESMAYPCNWDGIEAARRKEREAEQEAQRRRMNEAVLQKQRANNTLMLDILGKQQNAEMAALQAELGAIMSEEANNGSEHQSDRARALRMDESSSNGAAQDMRRSRGFFELWRSNQIYNAFSRIELFGAGGGAEDHNYFVVVVRQPEEPELSPSQQKQPRSEPAPLPGPSSSIAAAFRRPLVLGSKGQQDESIKPEGYVHDQAHSVFASAATLP